MGSCFVGRRDNFDITRIGGLTVVKKLVLFRIRHWMWKVQSAGLFLGHYNSCCTHEVFKSEGKG